MMRNKKGVLKWMSFGLSYFAILVVLSLLMFCFMLQMEVRNDIREAWSQVQPILFESAEGEELKVQNNDLFLFCLKSGEIVPARKAKSRYDFMGPLLNDFNVGSNRIFVLVDNRCPRTRLDELERGFVEACSNKVFAVGGLLGEEKMMACKEWNGQLSTNDLHGIRLDCSAVDALLYISPFVCNPLVGWLGDMIGVKYELQRPWRSRSGKISSDSILDLCPDLVSNVVAVRAWTKRDATNPDVIYLDCSYYIDIICGKDPKSADSYGKRDYALRCVSRIRKLAKEDVSDLMSYLRARDDAMREERVAKLKNGVVSLLFSQDPPPEELSETLLGMLEDADQPPEVLRLCAQHLSMLIGGLDDAALLRCVDGDSRRAAAVLAAIKRISDKTNSSCTTHAVPPQPRR